MGEKIKKFNRVLVANRGEIAIRVYRALNELGIQTVGIFSKEDRYALFRSKADESYMLDETKGPIGAYLDIPGIIKIAKEKQVDAIHPGYGFLSENPDFVAACEEAGIAFIGPTKETMLAMGDKLSSKEIAIACKVPIIPGVDHPVHSVEEATEVAEQIGYPIMLKASNGGGGRGMRIVEDKKHLAKEYEEARNESRKAFGDEKIFIEKYLKNPKHIEVQILGDKYGNVVHLFDRDCSVQRRHQKVVEFAPSFCLDEETRQAMFDDAIKIAKHVKFKSVGTLEFLVDADSNYYFIEMNPRIQVEHTVSECVTGIDLVQSQILVEEGYSLHSPKIGIPNQESIHCHGFSIQVRVTTENPKNNFLPDTGTISVYRVAEGNGIRIDGGNAYVGAEISPYYDSLLVKIIATGRTFDNAVKKALRALAETRVRGVKTNKSFLVNVLKHPDFLAGKCTTTFIENNPSLLKIRTGSSFGQDRATKIAEFIGNKIVNESKGVKPDFGKIVPPYVDPNARINGARDQFLKLGAEGFTQKILKDKKLYVTDTSMRDAHQSLFATRMRTYDLLNAAPATNQAMANAFSVEAWGGATFDVAYRFLNESPWIRLMDLREAMPNTLIQMLLRASNTVGYTNYPDNVVKQFIKTSAERGIDVFRIFDSLNWIENMKLPIETALDTGKIVEGAICYTGDILDPSETKYTIDYYLEKAKELESLGCHIFTIKDMAGLLKPYAAKKLFTELKKELKIPVNLHTHDTTGNGVSSVLMATEAGLDIADLAIESLSSLTSQPCMNSVVEALAGSERETELDIDELRALSKYYGQVRNIYNSFETTIKTPTTEIYEYEIPGGQYSNLLAQVKAMGSEDSFDEIKALYKQANELLGNIVKVTPTSKVVGDLAIFMQKNGLNKDNILTAGKDLSYPDSVVSYFMGEIGQPDGGFPAELQKIVLKGKEPLKERAGLAMKQFDFEGTKKMLADKYDRTFYNTSYLSYALYPKVYEDYLKYQQLYDDVSRLPSDVYFYGLQEGEEASISIGKGKEILIRYVDMIAEPDREGMRTLSFEINGAIRNIKILDKTVKENSQRKPKAMKDNPAHLGSSIPGTVSKIFVSQGDKVVKNSVLMTVEAMKMETSVVAPFDAVIEKILCSRG
ncbi:Pyruvate carboxyl transferase [Lachnospiraceae bacterium TWA4]|nr:Pyruvate carboxyl transferase [Lachnospiraceae bacterium TWA4]